MMRAALAVLCALVIAGCGGEDPASAPLGDTRQVTVADPDGDGALETGPGEPLVARGEPRDRTTGVLATLGVVTDAHVRDEESPGRVAFLDRLGDPFISAFRPHEALSAHVLDATVRALNAQRPELVLVTGDLIDSAQANEDRLARTVLDGGRATPDSGRPGYDGVQEANAPDPFYYRPDVDAPRHPGLLVRAQRAFDAPGLDAPWRLVPGNHDLLVQGELPVSAATNAAATGTRLVTAPTDETLSLARETAREELDALIAAGIPGRDRTIPADPERRHLAAPPPHHDAFDVGAHLRVIALDLVSRAGGSGGVVSPGTLGYLRAQLATAPPDRAVIVVSHQALDDPAAQAALDGDPRVIAELQGHRHRHRIEQRANGRWVIGTASLADWPQQARMLRLVRTADGGRALETWVVDHDRPLARTARELAYLDVQGGRPLGAAGRREDRNARLSVP